MRTKNHSIDYSVPLNEKKYAYQYSTLDHGFMSGCENPNSLHSLTSFLVSI